MATEAGTAALLARYLRQRRDLGERELFLDGMTALEALEAAAGRGAVAQPPAPAPGRPASAPATAGDARLQVLAQQASGCTACRLHEGRTQVVFGDGTAAAEVVVVGEAPGAEEDRTGRPFVGPAGKLLDLLLLSVGFPRERVYICNVLKCRPPGNRDPQADEVAACSGYLRAQLETIQPRALLAVGKFAAQTLLGSQAPIGKLRGRVHAYEGVPMVVSYHPAFLLRSPQWTRTTWEDLQLLRSVVDRAAAS